MVQFGISRLAWHRRDPRHIQDLAMADVRLRPQHPSWRPVLEAQAQPVLEAWDVFSPAGTPAGRKIGSEMQDLFGPECWIGISCVPSGTDGRI